MIKIDDVEKVVGTKPVPESWKRHITYAQDTIPDKEIEFLQEDYLTKIRKRIRLTESNVEHIQEAMHFIREDSHLRFLCWLWHCILFRKRAGAVNEVPSWPLPLQPTKMRGDLAGMFPAIVILSGYDSALTDYKKLGNLPEQVIDDTLTSVEECMNIFWNDNGYHGLTIAHLNRLLTHFRGTLFRIGRLEYDITTFVNPVKVFRNASTNEEVALSEANVRYRLDGHVDGTNDIYVDDQDAWMATFVETDTHITGNPISSDGYAKRDMVTLSKQEWSCVLEKGDNVLGLHIPRKGRLSKALCKESFDQAAAFFRTFFPEKGFRAFVCVTWMLDPQLQLLLDASSNVLGFQREFALYPVLSVDRTVYRFVFNSDPCPIEELPEKTSLQRKIKEYMLAGGHMHTGGGFITLS